MSFSGLYKKKYHYKTGELEKNLQFSSFIKKKKSKGRMGFHASSDSIFMKFHLKGRLLVLYKDEPTLTKNPNPIAMLFLKRITKIEDKVNGKEGHFKIEVGEQFWQFKCMDKDLRENWIKNIKFFQEYYKHDEIHIERNLYDLIDLQTLNTIKAENESLQFEAQLKKNNYDYTSLIQDKGLDKIFENLPIENLKNRLLISYTDKETVKRTDSERSEPQTPITPIPIDGKSTTRFQLSGLVSTNYCMIMISALSATRIDEDFLREDFDVIKKENLPEWMNFSIFYFFEYKDAGDDSFFRKATAVRDIEYVLFEKDGRTLKIQLPSKFFHLEFKSNWECLMWWQGFQKTCNYEKMLMRTKHKQILFDIEKLYEFHSKKKTNELKNVIKLIGKKLNSDDELSVFCQNLNEITRNVNFFLDAFLARKPFDVNLYKFCIYVFNRKVREMINKKWNDHHEPFASIEISDLIESIFKYQTMLKGWNIDDPNFGKWIEALFYTFINRHFVKSKEILGNILKHIKKDAEIVKDKLVEKSSGPLSFYINSLFNFYDKCKCIEVAEILIKECGINFFIFFTNVMKILRNDKLPLDNYLMLLNNKYLKCINKFKRKIKTDTNRAFKVSKIKILLNESDLINIIFSIEEKCSKEIQEYFYHEIQEKVSLQKKFLDFDLKIFMNEIVDQFKSLTKMLENKCHVETFFNGFFKEILFNYFKKFIDTASEITRNNYKYTKAKVEGDYQIVIDLAEEFAPDLKKTTIFYMTQLIDFLTSEGVHNCIVSILNIQVFYKSLITKENIKKLINAKVFFPESGKDYIRQFFYKSLDKNSNKSSKLGKMASIFYTAIQVRKFVKKLKRALKKIHKKRKSEIITKFIDKYHTPKLSILHPTYQEIYNTKCHGKMLLFDRKHSHKKISKYLKDKIKTNTGWEHYYFFFNIGALSITKDVVPKQVLFNILYRGFKEIKQLGSYCLYLKERTNGYAFYFKSKEKSLMFYNYFKILKKNCIVDVGKSKEKKDKKEKKEKKDGKNVRLVSCMTHLTWHRDRVVHKFDFKEFENQEEEMVDKIEFDDSIIDGSSSEGSDDE